MSRYRLEPTTDQEVSMVELPDVFASVLLGLVEGRRARRGVSSRVLQAFQR